MQLDSMQSFANETVKSKLQNLKWYVLNLSETEDTLKPNKNILDNCVLCLLFNSLFTWEIIVIPCFLITYLAISLIILESKSTSTSIAFYMGYCIPEISELHISHFQCPKFFFLKNKCLQSYASKCFQWDPSKNQCVWGR